MVAGKKKSPTSENERLRSFSGGVGGGGDVQPPKTCSMWLVLISTGAVDGLYFV